MTTYKIGDAAFEAESKYLTLNLSDSTSLFDDTHALRQRISEDGFLLLRGLHDPDEVLNVRREILSIMSQHGKLDPDAPLMEGVVHPKPSEVDTSSVRHRDHLKTEALRQLVYGPRIMNFFQRFLDSEPTSYNFQWLRTVGPGGSSTIHYDVVYMGRGTKNLYTCWTPLGHITPEMGPLAICMGSNRWQDVINTYGASDVDRDLTCGYFTKDPAELVDRFGGRWATTTFQPGDVVVLNMFTMHASLTNTTNRYRISCDTRYQPAGEPIDERWAGQSPITHTRFWAPDAQLQTVEQSRQKWGV
jgi:hypothetical protein